MKRFSEFEKSLTWRIFFENKYLVRMMLFSAINYRRMKVWSFRNQEKTPFPPHALLSVPPSKQSAQFVNPNFSEWL